MSDLEPLPDARERLDFRVRYDDAEMERIRRGTHPRNQDGKWLITWEEPWLRFHHSLRHCIYEVRFEPDGSGARVTEAWVNRDPAQHREWAEGHDRAVLEWIIADKLLHRPVCFPVATDEPDARPSSLLDRLRALLTATDAAPRTRFRVHGWLWRCDGMADTRTIAREVGIPYARTVELSADGWTGSGEVGDAVCDALHAPGELDGWDGIERTVRDRTPAGTLFVVREIAPETRSHVLRFATRVWDVTEDRGARDIVVLAGWEPGEVEIEWENGMTDALWIPDLFGAPVSASAISVSFRPGA